MHAVLALAAADDHFTWPDVAVFAIIVGGSLGWFWIMMGGGKRR